MFERSETPCQHPAIYGSTPPVPWRACVELAREAYRSGMISAVQNEQRSGV